MTDILDYEALVADHDERLATKLRGCVSNIEFLEFWVPDANLINSLANMAEAAQMSGCESFNLKLNTEHAQVLNLDELKSELQGLSELESQKNEQGELVLVFSIC